MYAFSAALALNKLKTELKPPGQTQFIAQVGGELGWGAWGARPLLLSWQHLVKRRRAGMGHV